MKSKKSRKGSQNHGKEVALAVALCVMTGICIWTGSALAGKEKTKLLYTAETESMTEKVGTIGEDGWQSGEGETKKEGMSGQGVSSEELSGQGTSGEKLGGQGASSEGMSGQSESGGGAGEERVSGWGEGKGKTAGEAEAYARKRLASMTLQEQVAQLFIITPEQLTGVGQVTQAGETTRAALERYPVGGLIYFAGNLQSEEQLRAMTSHTRQIARDLEMVPLFLSVDEEGGQVARIANHGAFSVPKLPLMAEIGATGDTQEARRAGETIGAYLKSYGFNLDFAPDADVLTNPDNQVVGKRSFGTDPELVSAMTLAYLDGLEEQGICGVPKHFPGHGMTKGDSHLGFAYGDKGWEELEKADLIPFWRCVNRQVPFIMAGHISLPKITGGDVPGSLSSQVLKEYLRDTMGYQGIIITDALNMGAIKDHYSAAEASIMALEAGADMLLMPADFSEAYEGMIRAVEQGRISRERLEESVIRILRVKAQYLEETKQ